MGTGRPSYTKGTIMDFEEFSNEEPEGAGLARLQALMDEADQLDATIDAYNEAVKSATVRYNHIRTQLLPQLLAELQTDKWTNSKGSTVKAEGFVSGSLPKDPEKREAAIKWLENNGGGDLIQTTVAMEFNKNGHNMALALADDLRKLGFEPIVESGVHAQTLQAHARERLKRGETIDLQTLGLYGGRVAKITHKKIKPGSDKE